MILLVLMFRIKFICYPEVNSFSPAHNAVVTSAIFAPNPSLMLSLDVQSEKSEGNEKGEDVEVLDTVPSGRYSYFICPTFFSSQHLVASLTYIGYCEVFMCMKNISCLQHNCWEYPLLNISVAYFLQT